MSNKDINITREVKAEDLKRAITQDENKLALILRKGKPLLPLCNARVLGPLNLKHHTIKKPIEIRNCEFAGEVDLRYCEFEQVVNFSGCTFQQEFNSGDETESHTVYKKDLICNNATFEKTVTAKFNGVRIGGSAFFNNASFLNRQVSLDLQAGSVVKGLECSSAIFEGPAIFNAFECNTYVSFEGATFKGSVSFNGFKCNGGGFFTKAQFQLQIVDQEANEEEKKSVEEANKEEIDFIRASFERNLQFQEATFARSVTFDSLACKGHGIFFITDDGVKFKAKKIVLSYASFGGNLRFDNAIVEGEADFQGLKCEGDGRFDNARFGRWSPHRSIFVNEHLEGEKVNLSFTCFGSSLSLENTRFGGEVDMSAARISQDLTLGGTKAHFEQAVKLSDVSMEELKLKGPSLPFNGRKLDLRRCKFNEFSGPDANSADPNSEEVLALEFAKAQEQTKFSRDPYLQLEKYYNSIGDLAQAKQVYYEGRCEFRRNAKYRNKQTKGIMQWLRVNLTSWGDWWLKWLTGYGVQTERLLVPIFLAILMGFVFFSTGNALKVTEPTSSAASAELGKKTATPSSEGGGSESGKTRQAKDSKIEKAGFIDSVAYNLDLFLPVDLDVAAQWEPQGQLRETYVFVHSLAGWLLIPLLITSLGGIIRRQ